MQALSVDPSARFQTITAMAEALRNPRFRRPHTEKQAQQNHEAEPTPGEEADVETVRIVPLSYKNLARWQASRPQTIPQRPLSPRPGQWQEQAESPESAPALQDTSEQIASADHLVDAAPAVDSRDTSLEQDTISPQDEVSLPAPSRPLETQKRPTTWRQRITGIFPAITPQSKKVEPGQKAPVPYGFDLTPQTPVEQSWFRQLQRFILGQPQQVTTSAAIIETPLRVQPDQGYTIRMHVMGRDEPVLPPGAKRGAEPAGLSALVHGDKVLIEVRSALYQSYAYIVQRALVTVPANGYVAEVMIPMRPLANGPSGRRDRLHIFFLNEQRQPLYDKPFVVELFISHLVQPGREGHNVLTLPI